jgi:hypothetical protein
LRNKPLREFSPGDLRFMLAQKISLPILAPMALDVLERDGPLVDGEENHGGLLRVLLRLGGDFWHSSPDLWNRVNSIVEELREVRERIDRELIPAAEAFASKRPPSG